MPKISRAPLRDRVRDHLVQDMISGALEPGEGFNETDLAAELGVSRTPIREALIRLKFEGLVDSDPGRGFFIRPLSAKEAADLYPLVAYLEGLALDTAGEIPEEVLESLTEINHRRKAALGNPLACFELDVQWHSKLTEVSENQQLKQLLRLLKIRQYRYERHFMRETAAVQDAIAEHSAIIENLRIDDLEEATRLLERHWLGSLEWILEHIGGGDAGEA